jgi:hypothetical protein
MKSPETVWSTQLPPSWWFTELSRFEFDPESADIDLDGSSMSGSTPRFG